MRTPYIDDWSWKWTRFRIGLSVNWARSRTVGMMSWTYVDVGPLQFEVVWWP